MKTPDHYITPGRPLSPDQKNQVIELLKPNEPLYRIFAFIAYLESAATEDSSMPHEPTPEERQLFDVFHQDALYIVNLMLGQLIEADLLPAVPETVAVSPEPRRLALAFQV